jgi:hypothetical protein
MFSVLVMVTLKVVNVCGGLIRFVVVFLENNAFSDAAKQRLQRNIFKYRCKRNNPAMTNSLGKTICTK